MGCDVPQYRYSNDAFPHRDVGVTPQGSKGINLGGLTLRQAFTKYLEDNHTKHIVRYNAAEPGYIKFTFGTYTWYWEE